MLICTSYIYVYIYIYISTNIYISRCSTNPTAVPDSWPAVFYCGGLGNILVPYGNHLRDPGDNRVSQWGILVSWCEFWLILGRFWILFGIFFTIICVTCLGSRSLRWVYGFQCWFFIYLAVGVTSGCNTWMWWNIMDTSSFGRFLLFSFSAFIVTSGTLPELILGICLQLAQLILE